MEALERALGKETRADLEGRLSEVVPEEDKLFAEEGGSRGNLLPGRASCAGS